MRERGREDQRIGHLGPVFFFLLLTFLWCGPILVDPAHVAADVGDPLHLAWVMAWVGHQILRDPLALFQSNSFYPYSNSLTFGDHLLPEGLLALPVNALTGNAVLALNLVTGFGLFSSALAGYFLVSKLLDDREAGLMAGTVLAFNGFMQGELLRVQVLQLQGWCLALLFLWRFTETPSWRHSIASSVALGLQGLTGTYYAIYSVALTPCFVLAAYAARRRRPAPFEALRLLVPALVIGLAGVLFLSPYRLVASQSLAQKPIANGADLAAFFLPGPDFWLLGGTIPSAPTGESHHFLGYVPLLLAALAAWTFLAERGEQDPAKRFLALSSLVLIAVGGLIAAGGYPRFMGLPLGESPYLRMLRSIPTLRGMATVERASVLVHFGLALLAGLGAHRMWRGKPRLVLATALATLAAAEQWTRPGPGFRVPAGAELPAVYRFLAGGTGAVAELPLFPDRLLRFRALYPYFSTYHWRPVPIGRTSFYPPAHDYLANLLQGFPDEVSIAALRALRIRDIVVHPRRWETRRAGRLRMIESSGFDLVREFPGDLQGAGRALDMGDERVYRLRPGVLSGRGCVPAREMDRRSWTMTSPASEGMERMRDEDLGTAWSTVVSQKEGDFIELHWEEARSLAAIRLALGVRVADFPTALHVDTALVPGEWTESDVIEPVVSAVETLGQLVASDPAASITIRIPSIQARAVRLRLGRDESRPGWNPWSISEIRLYSECSELGQL